MHGPVGDPLQIYADRFYGHYAVVTFAFSLNLDAYFIVLASSFVVYGICLAVIKHRQKQKLGGLHG